jgi:hypothetical protein
MKPYSPFRYALSKAIVDGRLKNVSLNLTAKR